MKTQTCFLQEMAQKERIQPSTVDLVHLVPLCLSLVCPPHGIPWLAWWGWGRDVGDMGGLGVTDGGYNALKLESAVLLTVSSI